MPRSNTYRLSYPALGHMSIEGHETAVTIPEGSLITVEDDVSRAEGNAEVVVDLGNGKVVMFAVDVRQRGQKVNH